MVASVDATVNTVPLKPVVPLHSRALVYCAETPVVKISEKVNILPTDTVCGSPVSVSLAELATESKLVKPVALTLTASPTVAPVQAFAMVIVVVFFVLTKVQTMAVSALPMVRVLPTKPVVPEQDNVLVYCVGKPVVKVSAKVSTPPTGTVCATPVSVSFAVLATEAKGLKPVAVTLTASFTVAPAQVLRRVTVAVFWVLV